MAATLTLDDATAAFARRAAPADALIGDAGRVAAACFDMARRFHRGGKLIVFGAGASATDAQHLSVEFVHPVIVGKRALPAIALTNDVATVTGLAARHGLGEMFAAPLRQLAHPDDIALGLTAGALDSAVLGGLVQAHAMGLLTVALTGADAKPSAAVDHLLPVASDDPRVVKEVQVTTYHVLWELVHVFFEQPNVLS